MNVHHVSENYDVNVLFKDDLKIIRNPDERTWGITMMSANNDDARVVRRFRCSVIDDVTVRVVEYFAVQVYLGTPVGAKNYDARVLDDFVGRVKLGNSGEKHSAHRC